MVFWGSLENNVLLKKKVAVFNWGLAEDSVIIYFSDNVRELALIYNQSFPCFLFFEIPIKCILSHIPSL